MYKVLLLGFYDSDGYGGNWHVGTGLFESPFQSPADLKEKITELALEFLRKEHAAGWEMPYDYNFGDILELCEEPDFEPILAAEGISLLPFGQDLDLDVFEHDEIWIHDHEVNGPFA